MGIAERQIMSICKEISLPAKIENLDSLKDFVASCLGACDFDKRGILHMEVAAEEVFVNICSYAYPNTNGTVLVYFSMNELNNTAEIKFVDTGISFNPLEMELPDLSVSLLDREEGGLGIFLTGKMVSSIYYKREDGRNILVLKKSRN